MKNFCGKASKIILFFLKDKFDVRLAGKNESVVFAGLSCCQGLSGFRPVLPVI
jgi:hypothetical protein